MYHIDTRERERGERKNERKKETNKERNKEKREIIQFKTKTDRQPEGETKDRHHAEKERRVKENRKADLKEEV